MLRTKTNGELRKEDAGQTVTLVGWVAKVRNLGALVFVDLRDRYGITQINIDPALFAQNELKNEYCVQVVGKVALREVANPNMATGEIEVKAEQIKVFAPSELTPFIIADKTDALEDTRLKWRYLDLRRPVLQHNLAIRRDAVKAAREYLESKSFMEVETPTLVKSTPEGARDYLVPSRTNPGCFYALPQSPQLFKQLLMIAGFDRYYQIARCYRDEDLRADRQPEFTQIDCEMSFIEREDVLQVISGMLHHVFEKVLNVELPEFARISYYDAINNYGSDKPDMRYGMLLKDVSALLGSGEFAPYKGEFIKALVVEGQAEKVSRKKMDEINLTARKYKIHPFAFFKVESGALTGSLCKDFSPKTLEAFLQAVGAHDGDLIVVSADGDLVRGASALGAVRCDFGQELGLRNPDIFKPLFVLDWPLFERKEDGTYESLANPFCRPRDEDIPLLDVDPTKVMSYAYDTVINGYELSSGSLRIFDGKLQQKIFELLGLKDEDIKKKFGFFVDAFRWGTPPHGGFAIGLERLCMILAKTDNVRDVVAFPKNLKAEDVMCDCPSSVEQSALDLVGIQVKPDLGPKE